MAFDMAGGAYDRFMGRYSTPLGVRLSDWVGVVAGERALDVGCGTGAWTKDLVRRLGAERVSAVDPSASFVQACREHLPGLDVRLGVAGALPFEDQAFDLTGANLVAHFMPDPVAGVREMARVTRPGCWVAATVWDLAGRRAPMAPIWRGLSALGPARDEEPGSGAGAPGGLVRIFTAAGLEQVEEAELAVTVVHPSFEEWWEPHLHGVGPVGETIAALDPAERVRLERACRDLLGDGPFEITAVAFAARGRAS
ncbi:MAG: class I SAM-dependent methyltransferase [Nocardioides sp.]|uniref:class I SAM-dependent methyltransferase n=1 Tax=Nocardioides sp. TaxID=35761 RepID=UPI003F022118